MKSNENLDLNEAHTPIDLRLRKYIQDRLINWSKSNSVEFPWRQDNSPFHCLVVEILLQRTKAEQVVPVYNTIRTFFPTADTLARCTVDEIRGIINSLGLSWRANYLKKLAEEVSKHEGRIPDNYKELIELPGVGSYAAAAYLSLHRGKRSAIIDSNVVRLYCRILGRECDAETRREKWLQEFSDYMTPPRRFRAYNYAALDFARYVCRPKPDCAKCPIKRICIDIRIM
jgi:A/G-specific adenine glycosylase